MPLLSHKAIVVDTYTKWNGEGPAPAGDLLVSSRTVLQRPEILAGRRIGVALANTEDALTLTPVLRKISLVVLVFPLFRDGRAYTQAAILRETGFRGEIRATGRVLIDQISFMARVGFTTFEVAENISTAEIVAALQRYRAAYQTAPGDFLPDAQGLVDVVEAAA